MSKNYLKEDEARKLPLLKTLGVPYEDLQRDVEILKNWAKQQQHLPQDFLDDDSFLERLLVNNKFRIEQSKIKYDNYFTLRGIYKSLYDDIENVIPSSVAVWKIPLKNLTHDEKRILLLHVNPNHEINADFHECLKFQLAVSELMNKYCFSDGRVVILDFKGIKGSIFKNFDLLGLYQHLKMIKSAFSGRVSSVHVINITNFAKMILSGIKLILQGDIVAKINIHDSMESLHKEIPQNLLPKDYGGDDISVKEYIDIWDGIIKEEETFLKNLRNQVADESLRIGTTNFIKNDFGVDGTFKKLNLD